MPGETDHFQLQQCCLDLHAAESPKAIAEAMERAACELLNSQRATAFRLETKDGVKRLVPICAHEDVPASIRVSQGIAGNVARQQVEYLCNAPGDDELFVEALDGVAGAQTHNLVSVPMAQDNEIFGVLQAVNRLDRPFQNKDLRSLRMLADHGAKAMLRLRSAGVGWDLLMSLANTVASMVDERYGTVGHVDRVRRMALALGKDLQLSERELRELELAATLHDIGRLGVSPESIRNLRAEAPGTGQQLEHALNKTLVQRLRVPEHLSHLATVALAPHRLRPGAPRKDEPRHPADPLAAKILAVADTFDLLSIGACPDRPNATLTHAEAVKEVQARTRQDLDPGVVNTLVAHASFKMERRAHPRFASKTPMQLKVLSPDAFPQEGPLSIRSLDLSQGGAQFQCSERLPDDALLELRIVLPTGAIAAFARIARQLPDDEGTGFRVGVYFLGYRDEGLD